MNNNKVLKYIFFMMIFILLCFYLCIPSIKEKKTKASTNLKVIATENPTNAPTNKPTIAPTIKATWTPTIKPTRKPEKKKKKHSRAKIFMVTAYCPCYECSEEFGTNTATGVKARARHTIAVDPKVIKYGTKVIIDGVEYTAEDCGGKVKGNHIDIYFNTHEEVERFGVKYKKVRLIGND